MPFESLRRLLATPLILFITVLVRTFFVGDVFGNRLAEEAEPSG